MLDGATPRDLAVPLDGALAGDAAFSDLAQTDLAMMQGPLAPPITVQRTSELTELAAGDLDGDGRDDLVVANPIEVFTLLSASGLAQPGFIVRQGGGRMLSLADLDRDGKKDLVRTVPSAGNSASELLWQRGVGDGTFGAATSVLEENYLTDAHVADVNGDGRLDLVAQMLSSETRVWLGHGDGSFDDFKKTQAPTQVAGFITLADFNRDGKLDVAGTEGPDSFSVLLGNGDGTFTYKASFGWEWREAIHSGDLNGDGVPDIYFPGTPPDIYGGMGDGTFTQENPDFAGGDIVGMLMDFNRDSVLDTVQTGYLSPTYAISIALGHDNFQFDDVLDVRIPASAYLECLVSGDFDGDQVADVAAATSQTLMIIDGATSAVRAIPLGAPQQSLLADFDGDGHLDVLGAQYDGAITLFQGAGDGSLRVGASVVPPNGTARMALGDFNEDGRPDAVVGSLTSQLVLGDGSSGIRLGSAILPVGAPLTAGDFNGDGHLDVVGVTSGVPTVVLGNGDGTFGPPATAFMGSRTADLRAANMDGDSHLDLVRSAVVSDTNPGPIHWEYLEVSVWQGYGDGTFSQRAAKLAGISPGSQIAVADMNDDGALDVVSVSFADANMDLEFAENPSIVLVYGNGDGTLSAPTLIRAPVSRDYLGLFAIGDLNGDRRPDVVISDAYGTLSLLGGSATGLEPAIPLTSVGVVGLGLGDFDGDGALDISGTVGASLSVWLNRFPH
jgi:FG-GAP-like repeat/FG-GAP repeat